jgi:hypothetical protein
MRKKDGTIVPLTDTDARRYLSPEEQKHRLAKKSKPNE